MNAAMFWVLYLIFMIPTYFVGITYDVIPPGATTNIELLDIKVETISMTGMFVCLFVLVTIGFFRGRSIGKPWLVVFPIIALLFDVFLLGIPLIPTVMHVLTLVLGTSNIEIKKASSTWGQSSA